MIVLYWLAVVCLGLFAWLLAAVAACIIHHLIRDAARRRYYATVPRAPEPDRLSQLAAEQRDDPPCNHAWPPAPKPATGHVWRITAGQQRCGCVLTTTPDGVRIDTCPAHDPAFVTEWERRLSL